MHNRKDQTDKPKMTWGFLALFPQFTNDQRDGDGDSFFNLVQRSQFKDVEITQATAKELIDRYVWFDSSFSPENTDDQLNSPSCWVILRRLALSKDTEGDVYRILGNNLTKTYKKKMSIDPATVADIGDSLLQFCTHYCFEITTVKYLVSLSTPAMLNYQNLRGETALHFAVKKRSYDASLIRFLIEHGADQDIEDHEGKKPLHVAIEIRHCPILVKTLAEQYPNFSTLLKKHYMDYAFLTYFDATLPKVKFTSDARATLQFLDEVPAVDAGLVTQVSEKSVQPQRITTDQEAKDFYMTWGVTLNKKGSSHFYKGSYLLNVDSSGAVLGCDDYRNFVPIFVVLSYPKSLACIWSLMVFLREFSSYDYKTELQAKFDTFKLYQIVRQKKGDVEIEVQNHVECELSLAGKMVAAGKGKTQKAAKNDAIKSVVEQFRDARQVLSEKSARELFGIFGKEAKSEKTKPAQLRPPSTTTFVPVI